MKHVPWPVHSWETPREALFTLLDHIAAWWCDSIQDKAKTNGIINIGFVPNRIHKPWGRQEKDNQLNNIVVGSTMSMKDGQ